MNGEEGGLFNSARELCWRCGSGGSGNVATAAILTTTATAPTTAAAIKVTSRSSGSRPTTNAKMMKRTTNYSLIKMEETELKLPGISKGDKITGNVSASGMIVTKSSKGRV